METLLVVEKSKFYGLVYKVETKQEMEQIIKDLWKEYNKARHICYAAIGKDFEKVEDDGEPSGTAGRPIHNILKYNDCEGLLLVVVRYFGGKKLGAGRLLRSYSKCASMAFKEYISNNK